MKRFYALATVAALTLAFGTMGCDNGTDLEDIPNVQADTEEVEQEMEKTIERRQENVEGHGEVDVNAEAQAEETTLGK